MTDAAKAQLRFREVETLADLGTYVARARSLDADGAIRLQARGEVLAAWVQVLPGHGILRTGAVVGLRVMELDGPHDLDVTVPLAAVSDRLARRQSTTDVSTVLQVPPMQVAPSWAAISAPTHDWRLVGEVSADVLMTSARQGIEAVAQGTPPGAGSAAVAALRKRVWAQRLSPDPHAPTAGMGFATYALGFAKPGDSGAVLNSGAWMRVRLPHGDVLGR